MATHNDDPQETMTSIRRALKMYEILSQWDADNRDNKVNKIPDVGIKEDGTPQGVSFAGESSR